MEGASLSSSMAGHEGSHNGHAYFPNLEFYLSEWLFLSEVRDSFAEGVSVASRRTSAGDNYVRTYILMGQAKHIQFW